MKRSEIIRWAELSGFVDARTGYGYERHKRGQASHRLHLYNNNATMDVFWGEWRGLWYAYYTDLTLIGGGNGELTGFTNIEENGFAGGNI
jgi:hypothetical protein